MDDNPYQSPRSVLEPDRAPHQSGLSQLKSEVALVLFVILGTLALVAVVAWLAQVL